MKRIEITYNGYQRELEKLNAQLERAQKSYGKKLAAADKAGVTEWNNEQHNAWLETIETVNGWIVNKADIKINEAWWDLYRAKRDIEDITGKIERAEKRLHKAEQEVNAYYEELDKLADLKAKEELMKKQFEQEQKEWAKDGITLNRRYEGTTPQGKQFAIYSNNGYAYRSLHCFQLVIEGDTIFTSGEFWRAYAVIKKS